MDPSPDIGRHVDVGGLWRLAADALPVGVLILSADGVIAELNRSIEETFGFSRDELLGRSVQMLLPESLARLHGAGGRPDSAGQHARSPAASPMQATRRDGSSLLVEVEWRPAIPYDGRWFVAIVSVPSPARRRDADNRSDSLEEGSVDRLMATLSVQFINVPAEQVDEVIRAALQRIGELLDIDRCTFYRIQPDGVLVDPIGWQRSPFPPAPAPLSASARFPWALSTVRSGQPVMFSHLGEIPNPVDRQSYRALGIHSALTFPLRVGGHLVGAVGFNMLRAPRVWTAAQVSQLEVLAATFASVLSRRQSEIALNEALEQVKHLSDQLERENTYLRREVEDRLASGPIVGQSSALRQVMDLVAQVAATEATVLLLGETGTGKEMVATEIHQRSSRHHRSMVRVNCSAIPATLIESELFGREKGAFTGAVARQIGRFELADQSTIFLDEIGELPADVQVKLLRVLEEKRIERLGSPRSIRVSTRIIAATHRDLERLAAIGEFRQDLFYRLNVFPIRIPPLRERPEDIPLLVWHFVAEFSKAFGKPIESISSESLAALQRYSWPGNIRELRNVVERAMIGATERRLTIPSPAPSLAATRVSTRLIDVETAHIRDVLTATGWRIRGAGGAAERLGLKPTTLETRLAKLGLRRPSR